MAQCPNCGATLKEDYGMSQCPKCGVFCFIDMEGNAFISSAGADDDAEVGFDEVTNVDFTASSAKIPADLPISESGDSGHGFELPESPPSLPESPSPLESDFGAEPAAPLFEQSFEPQENPGEQEFAPLSFDPEPAANPKEMPIPDFGPADDPLGLADFANSELSSAKDGPLLFRIRVSGIDSKEMRETIREVLEDPRFGWDADQMFARLEKGVLTIENLSPVKASILVTKIKRLPVKIRWEQYAISQADSSLQ